MSLHPNSGVIASIEAAAAKVGAEVDERGVPVKMGRQYQRTQQAAGYDAESHTVSLALTSEEPVERWFGIEILRHNKGAIRKTRLENGISLLFNHNYDQLLGRSISYEVPNGGPLRLVYRFGPSALALEKEAEVAAEILKDTSGGYQVFEWVITEDKNGVRTYEAVDWEPLEGSLVTVPADPSVGVGRGIAVKYTLRKLGDEGQIVESRKYAFDPGLNRSVEVDEDGEEDDDEDDDDADPEEAERSVESEAAPEDPAPTSSAPEPSTTHPETQRTAPMEPNTAGVDPAKQNEERITGLRTLHQQYPNQFSARSLEAAIALDLPLSDAKRGVADQIIAAAQRNDVATIGEELFSDMSQGDRSRYSLQRAYAAALNVHRRGSINVDAKLETEVSDELTKRAEARGISGLGAGIVVPSATTRMNLSGQEQVRAITSGGNAGQSTNFTVVNPDPIELLRSRCVLLAMGAQMLTGLHGAMQMTQQTGAASSSWQAELGSVANSDPTLSFFTMKPNRLSIMNSYSRDFLAQSSLSVDSFLANDRNRVLAIALDTAGLAGSGTAPVPLGIMNRTGLAAVLAGTTRASNGVVTAGQGGVPMTFVDWNNMEAAIATANADIGTMGIITTPRVRAAARSTPKIPGTASDFIWPTRGVGANGVEEGPLGYRAITTSNAVLTGFTANGVSGLHAALMGVFDQILFGDWGLGELIADNITGAAQAIVKITEHAFYDCNVRQLPAFCLCASALPS